MACCGVGGTFAFDDFYELRDQSRIGSAVTAVCHGDGVSDRFAFAPARSDGDGAVAQTDFGDGFVTGNGVESIIAAADETLKMTDLFALYSRNLKNSISFA